MDPSNSPTSESQGKRYLQRLERFLDVVYALVFLQILLYLPQAEGMEWVGKPWGLLKFCVSLWGSAWC